MVLDAACLGQNVTGLAPYKFVTVDFWIVHFPARYKCPPLSIVKVETVEPEPVITRSTVVVEAPVCTHKTALVPVTCTVVPAPTVRIDPTFPVPPPSINSVPVPASVTVVVTVSVPPA